MGFFAFLFGENAKMQEIVIEGQGKSCCLFRADPVIRSQPHACMRFRLGRLTIFQELTHAEGIPPGVGQSWGWAIPSRAATVRQNPLHTCGGNSFTRDSLDIRVVIFPLLHLVSQPPQVRFQTVFSRCGNRVIPIFIPTLKWYSYFSVIRCQLASLPFPSISSFP